MNDDGYTISKEELQRYMALESKIAELEQLLEHSKKCFHELDVIGANTMEERDKLQAHIAELENKIAKLIRLPDDWRDEECPLTDYVLDLMHEYDSNLTNWGMARNQIAELERENAQIVELSDLIKAKADEYKARIAELERQVADLCPIGDLVGLPAWQVEKAGYMEHIADLERVLRMYPEWIPDGWMETDNNLHCPICGCDKNDGHSDDCPRQAVLNET